MSDAELQAKYPLPPEVREMVNTMFNDGKPIKRPAAQGVAEMQVILRKLQQDKIETLAALDESAAEPVRHAALLEDLADLNREIRDYTARLGEYGVQLQALN